jgi:lactoylglutathione lyase
MELKLSVIRSSQPEQLAGFYTLFGLSFSYQKHGSSPMHYSAINGSTVFEIYPFRKNQAGTDPDLRLGFGLDNFEETIRALKEQQIFLAAAPMQTAFGYRAVVTDPDGRKIELYKK